MRRSRRRLAGVAASGLLLVSCSGSDDADVAARAGRSDSTTTTVGLTTTVPVTALTTTTLAPGPVEAAPDRVEAAELADRLATAERAIRDPSTPDTDLPRLGRDQQAVYRTLVAHPELQADVLSRLPADLRPIAEANVLAGSELRRLADPQPELPRWRIIPPEPVDTLVTAYRDAESASGVPWEYLAAIHVIETRVGRIRGDSSAGAQGPMQFLPSTWEIYGSGGDINSTHDAIRAAARLLRANGAPDDMASALYAYNPSQRYVRAVTAYAQNIEDDERAFLGYYHWQVYYGDVLLPEGYGG